MALRFLFFLLCGMLLAGCAENHALAPVPEEVGTESVETTDLIYHYTGYTRDGRAVVQGTIQLVARGDNGFTGRWRLRSLVDPNRIGPQVGTGTLAGQMVNGSLVINLNPDMVDNNVILTGRLSRVSFVGRWEWVGFAGPITGGTFHAQRRVSTEPALVD